MPGLRTFALTVAVRGGARWEDETTSGWSHCLEHLVFKGAGEMSARDIVERIEGEGGSINAATGYERTSFEVRGLDGALETAMQVVADLMFAPTLDPAEIEREKDVIAQEIAEAFDTPDDHVFEMAQARAFEGQAMGRPILGSVASLAPITRERISDWRAKLYAPERMVVAVSGAVREDELMRLSEAWFGAAPASVGDRPAASTFVGGDAVLARRIEQANLVFQLPACSATDEALPATRLMAEILGGGMASRLFQSAREERGLAYAIDAYHEAYDDSGVLGVYAGAAAERAEDLARVCAQEIRALADMGPTEQELKRAKAVSHASLWMSDESPAVRSGRAAAQVLMMDRLIPSEVLAERVSAVTGEAVRAAAAFSLNSGAAATAVLGARPARAAGAVFRQALFA